MMNIAPKPFRKGGRTLLGRGITPKNKSRSPSTNVMRSGSNQGSSAKKTKNDSYGMAYASQNVGFKRPK